MTSLNVTLENKETVNHLYQSEIPQRMRLSKDMKNEVFWEPEHLYLEQTCIEKQISSRGNL